ncbi:MAG: hypothetical protein JSS21_11205 [Proteobacteria bacterium]|nr:hypothetical protein [Pseudomonadota bacterium]
MAVNETSFPAPCMTPSIAAGRAGKARMSEHMDVRVRAGARSARSAGKSSRQEVGEIVMFARNGFGDFCRTKVARSRQRAEPRFLAMWSSLDYKVHPWTLPFGPTFGRSNSFQTNLSGLRRNDEQEQSSRGSERNPDFLRCGRHWTPACAGMTS